MKILCSVFACIPNRGSEPGIGWNWVLEYARIGHSVWCFTLPDGKNEIEAALKMYPDLKITPVYIIVPAILERNRRSIPLMYTHYLVWQYRAARTAIELDKEVDFDLVMHLTWGSFQLGSGMWRLNKPFVFGPVGGGSFPPVAFKKYFHHKWRTEIFRNLTSKILLAFNKNVRLCVENADLVLVANTDTMKMATKFRPKRLEIEMDVGLPPSFFPDHHARVRDRKIFKILWVGRIFGRKGLPLVMEALSRVRKDVPFQLTIIGDGDLGYLVPEWLERYGLKERTKWLGQVPWEQVRDAYLNSDVFMFCSLRDTTGAQFLEAMAFSLPIITLDHQGAGDHIPDDAGIKVPVTTPEDTVGRLAAAVEKLYDSPEICETSGANGLAFAKTQIWGVKARKMVNLFETILKVGSPVTSISDN